MRAVLLDQSSAAASLRVLAEVSRRVSGRLGQALDFKALIETPDSPEALAALAGLGCALDDRNTRHFAGIAATMPARVGGPHARITRALAAVGEGD